MRGIPLVRVAAVLPFASFLLEIGAPLEQLWTRAGLSPRSLLDPDGTIPLSMASRFAEDAAASQGVPDLGLVVARRSGLESIGGFGTGIRGARTLQHAIATTRDTVVCHNSGVRYWAVTEGESVRLCLRWRRSADCLRQLDLFSLALMVDLVRLVAGVDWCPGRADLQSSGVFDPRNAEMFCAARVRQGQAATSIILPRSLLRRPLHLAPQSPAALARHGAWLRSAPPTDLVGSARVVIESLLEGGRADLDTVAHAAGTSARTFQRWLTESGVSFSALVDRTRFARATRLLEDSDLKFLEIALELGYSDPAHFTRAFRRWTSATPLEHRKRHLLLRADARRSA